MEDLEKQEVTRIVYERQLPIGSNPLKVLDRWYNVVDGIGYRF